MPADLKNVIFRVAGTLLRRGPMATLAREFFRDRAAVVFYHGVWADADLERRQLFGGMPVSDFADDMQRLARFFDIVPLSQILTAEKPRDSRRPRLAVTFDDGLDLTAGGATDVLDRLGIRATMFVNTACLAGSHLMWMHRFSAIRATCGPDVLLRELNNVQERRGGDGKLASLDDLIAATRAWPQERKDEYAAQMWERAGLEPIESFLARHRPYLDADALRDWLRRGHEIGFHTHSHPFCSQLTDDLLEREVIAPVAGLKSQFGVSEMSLAYPFGDRCRPEHEQRLREHGVFTALVGTAGFSGDPPDPNALERVEAEAGIDREVFGKPILRGYRRRR